MELEAAYDFGALLDALKADGLDLAEDAVKKLVEHVFGWLEASAKLSDNTYDDIALVLLPLIKAKALELADDIDGEEG